MDSPNLVAHEHLVVEQRGPVTEVTLHRPERRNPLSLGLMRELTETLHRAGGRVIVIGGAGGCFSAGHDLTEMVDRTEDFYQELFDACTVLMGTVHEVPQPVIAKVQGVASAAGCQLVAACDLAVADEGARFATPGVKIGLFCSTPMVPLTRAIGRKRAMEMLLTGDFVDAVTAREWGLVNRVVPLDRLDHEVTALAARIATSTPVAVGLGKETFYRQIDVDEPAAYDLTKAVMTRNALAREAQEGIGAFLERRPPTWQGC